MTTPKNADDFLAVLKSLGRFSLFVPMTAPDDAAVRTVDLPLIGTGGRLVIIDPQKMSTRDILFPDAPKEAAAPAPSDTTGEDAPARA